MHKAFTLIELMIVIAILMILVGASSAYLVTFGKNAGSDDGAATLKQAYLLARSNSQANLDNSEWGLYLENTRIIIFPGVTYNVGDARNQVKVLPANSTLTWSILGGGAEIKFQKNSAETLNTGSLTLNSGGGTTVTLNINSEGMIE